MKITLNTNKKVLLSELLTENGIHVSMPCGGMGKCGKCFVKLNGETVRACSTYAEGSCVIEVSDDSEGTILQGGDSTVVPNPPREGFGAAVDLGTTTIAVSVFNLLTGIKTGDERAWNAQKSYGADVISRIDYINKNPDGLQELSSLVRNQVREMISAYDVTEIMISGNTVMQHIFAGISPSGIAVAPFTPTTLFDDFRDELDGIPVYYAPCIAGYVGGDIVSGLLATGLYDSEKPVMFIDIGTNGEMSIGNRDGIFCCAVACGPAFEGAEISCGMPGLAGAVSHVENEDGKLSYETIGNTEARGICGSGLIDLLSVLLETGDLDQSGRLENKLFRLTDTVSVNHADVRKLQLAKAAVRAGISVLMSETGLSFDDIDALYLGGGFGTFLKGESAVAIDMLPAELLRKIKPVGNASLNGASIALLCTEQRKKLIEIQRKCRYIELSGNSMFNDEFVEHMLFGEE